MPQAVRFDQYGGIDVLHVVEVDRPVPGAGQVLVAVQAAGINPGEAKIRMGLMAQRWPATFPSGQGSDLAGIVDELGDGVTGFAVGDEVLGWTDNRASQAAFVVVDAAHLVPKPAGVSWEAAGSCSWRESRPTRWSARSRSGRATTSWWPAPQAASARSPCSLPRNAGATVIGLASETHHQWLSSHGAIPVTYGDGVADRVRAASGGRVDAFLDTIGGGYVELALELGVRPERIDTIADFGAGQKYGVKTDGSAAGASADVLAELAGLIDNGQLEIPIAAVYPLARVQDAYRELEQGHALGKIVLKP